MDVILALGAEIRKMFAGDAVLSLAAVGLVGVIALTVHVGVLSRDLAPWLLMIGVAVVLIIAVNLTILKMIRKTNK